MERSRLLFVVNNFKFFLSHRIPIAIAARDAGYEVHVAADGASCADVQSQGLTTHVVSVKRSMAGPAQELRTIAQLYRLYRTLRPGVVHHVTAKPVLYGSLAARLAGVPAVLNAIPGLGVVSVGEGLRALIVRRAYWSAYRVLMRHPNMRVVFQNRDDRAQFLAQGLVTEHQCEMISGSGVDLDDFHPVPETEGLPVVILPARMLRFKGVGDFVEAARILREQGVGARFALVGDLDVVNPAHVPEQELLGWERAGTIEWWGYRDDMPAITRHAHIVCLPSHSGEGLPKALAEASAAGRPIVTTDVPGCRDVVANGQTGFIVPPHDPASLAAALKTLIDDPLLRQTMGTAGRAKAVAEFDIRQVVARHLEIYGKLRANQA